MSTQDAETYVASVQTAHDIISPGHVIIFVDFRERRTRTGTASLLEAINALDPMPAQMHVLRANLHVADALVCRVVDANASILEVPSSSTSTSSTAVNKTWHERMNEAVRIDGCGACDVLSPSGSCIIVPLFAYERKTTSDFVSSIQPGRGRVGGVPTTQRWLDQKARLSAFCNATGCLPALILEGYLEHAATGKPLGVMQEKRAHSALHSASRIHGLPFWNSANIFDSARLLVRDANMLLTDATLMPNGWMRLGTIDALVQKAADGASSLVVRKSDQDTPESWWRGSLCLVPKMSPAMANAIAATWPSLTTLQLALRECSSGKEQEALIANVLWAPDKAKQDGKQRRIGPVVSRRVLERLGCAMEVPVKKRKMKKK